MPSLFMLGKMLFGVFCSLAVFYRFFAGLCLAAVCFLYAAALAGFLSFCLAHGLGFQWRCFFATYSLPCTGLLAQCGFRAFAHRLAGARAWLAGFVWLAWLGRGSLPFSALGAGLAGGRFSGLALGGLGGGAGWKSPGSGA